jgi:hypothetical protein
MACWWVRKKDDEEAMATRDHNNEKEQRNAIGVHFYFLVSAVLLYASFAIVAFVLR